MRIYFTLYIIPVVLVALIVFWGPLRRRDTWRLWFMSAVSIATLALLNPAFAVIAVGLVVVTHQLVAAHQQKRLGGGRAVLIAVVLAVVVLAVGKYGQKFSGAVWGNDTWIYSHLLMPLGISYFVFRLLQYVFDCVRGVIKENRFRDLLAFVMFIPTFPAGPLETYQGFYEKRSTGFDRELFYRGLRRIVVGYFKKAFVVDFIFAIYIVPHVAKVASPHYHFSPSAPLAPLAFVVVTFLRAYLDLSAYTDLAIGFSRLFGFRIMENFNNPLFKRNMGEFWRSWHISLSSWCRNNVYFPVFGLTRKVWLGLYSSMMVMGLWHYVDLQWACWALYHGTGLTVVNAFQKRKKKFRKEHKGSAFWSKKGLRHRLMTPLWYLMTFFYAALGYAFVGARTFPQAVRIFTGVFWGVAVYLKHLV